MEKIGPVQIKRDSEITLKKQIATSLLTSLHVKTKNFVKTDKANKTDGHLTPHQSASEDKKTDKQIKQIIK